MASVSNNSSIASYATAAQMASLTGATRPVTPGVQPAPTVTAGTAASEQAASGAAQATTEKAEPFNAPKLRLPADPSTRDVMAGLVGAMSDPSVNRTTANQLYQLHDQLMQAEKAMLQVVLDGLLV